VDEVTANEYQALFLPGGVMSPDALRIDDQAIELVRDFMKSGKPIASICHGPQILIETKLLKGRTLTSWPSLKTDLKNAGAKWMDEEVCVDNNLITSRKPADIPAFNMTMIRAFVDSRSRSLSSGADGYSINL
jgi:protease I